MKRSMYKSCFKYVLLALIAIGVFMLTGCGEKPAADTAAAPVPEKNPYITCFGTIMARETCPIIFPFNLHIGKVEARSGQAVSIGDVLFQADPQSLLDEQTVINQDVLSLQYQKSGVEEELAKLQKELAVCTLGAKEFDVKEMMGLIKAIASNKASTAKLTSSRLALINALERFGLIQYYQELQSIAMSRDKFYWEQANPLLMQLDCQFDTNLPVLSAQIDEKTALVHQTESKIILAQAKADAVSAFLSGQAYHHVKFFKNGNVSLADSGYLVDTVHILPNTLAPADMPVASLLLQESLEAVCFVEEQLIKGIKPGNRAQISLYTDSTVIALGTVSFVSQKAVEVNGETAVEVVISYESGIFLPGYNITAKIFTKSSE